MSYTIFDLNDKPKELFPTGKSPEPSVTKLSDNSFLLGKDSHSIVMDTKGELIQHNPIKWPDTPSVIGTNFHLIRDTSNEFKKKKPIVLLIANYFSMGRSLFTWHCT